MRVFVALPCYNVGKLLPGVLSRIDRSLVHEIIVVDDGSRDNTAEAAQKAPGVTLVQHPQNKGYGATQKTMIREFMQRSRDPNDVMVFLHGDGEMLPEELPDLLDPIKDPSTEVVLGSRMVRGNKKGRVSRTLWKRGVDIILSTVLNVSAGTRLTTYFSGYRAVKRSVLQRLNYEAFSDDTFFDMQALKWFAQSCRFVEVPISNAESDTPVTYSRVRLAIKILKLVWRSMRDRSLKGAAAGQG